MYVSSGETTAERRSSSPAEDYFQRGADAAVGAGVRAFRVRVPRAALRAGGGSRALGDAGQDLVPEPTRKGQAHREGTTRPALQVTHNSMPPLKF